MSNYPEHDKLSARKAEHEVLTDFLSWLDSQSRYVVGQWIVDDIDELSDREREEMLAKYLGVNRNAFMVEKNAMLEEHRRINRVHQGEGRDAAQQG